MNTFGSDVALVGAGRLGTALAGALRAAGVVVHGPFGRGYDGSAREADVVLLCVPDREISAAAALIRPRADLLVGHCSGATTLEAIGAHEAFSLHPLMTIPATGAEFTGALAAVAGATARALAVATALAESLGMHAVRVDDADRTAYHAAAAVASNQLLAVLQLASELAEGAGLSREHLAPLVRATVDNWVTTGAADALTGPVVRGDEQTIDRHRSVIAERCPQDTDLYAALLEATRRLAARGAASQ